MNKAYCGRKNIDCDLKRKNKNNPNGNKKLDDNMDDENDVKDKMGTFDSHLEDIFARFEKRPFKMGDTDLLSLMLEMNKNGIFFK